jgi:dihydroorotate dehydrogenase (fumarate)
MGLKLKNPLIVSSSPFTEKVENAQKLEEAGIAAVVMHSLFEEQITRQSMELDHFLNSGTESFSESLSYLPNMGRYSMDPDNHLEQLRRLKKALHIPVIASLNGVSSGGWTHYAQKIEQAGADALELNIYYLPTDTKMTSAELEDNYVKLVKDVRQKVKFPLAVKLSPFFTALPNLANRLADAGANALVLFNRFYQPDIDLESLEVVSNLVLSSSPEMRLPLRWVAILYKRIKVDFGLTSGVQTTQDALKAILVGASAVFMASAILKHGTERITKMLSEMQTWMKEHEYDSLQQMVGSVSQSAVKDPAAYERANYMKVLGSYSLPK